MENLKLHAALADVRKAASVGKTGKNPMFKSEYSTLGDVLTALDVLPEYGLSFAQYFQDGALVTTVVHLETGEKISSFLQISPEKDTPQSFISCVTYFRRASLLTMFGLNANDDDGNLSSGSGAFPSRSLPKPKRPVVASTPAAGLTSNDVLAEKLDACASVRDVNALYTKLYGGSGIKAPDDQISMFSKRKDELK
tara:strand:- start:369 stop:956 length:588 start_codon:yes stop_codon:yes gene_type:complete